MTDYKRRFRAILNYSPTDPYDCEACFALDDQCPYHRGVADGIEWFARHLARIADDPEVLNAIKTVRVR